MLSSIHCAGGNTAVPYGRRFGTIIDNKTRFRNEDLFCFFGHNCPPPPPSGKGAVTRVVCPPGPPVYMDSCTATRAPRPGRPQGREALGAPWGPSNRPPRHRGRLVQPRAAPPVPVQSGSADRLQSCVGLGHPLPLAVVGSLRHVGGPGGGVSRHNEHVYDCLSLLVPCHATHRFETGKRLQSECLRPVLSNWLFIGMHRNTNRCMQAMLWHGMAWEGGIPWPMSTCRCRGCTIVVCQWPIAPASSGLRPALLSPLSYDNLRSHCR